MGFKTVFMVVGAGQNDAEIDRAVAICEALGAHLSLLVLGIAPPPPASPYGVVSNDIWAGDIRQGQEEADGPGQGDRGAAGGDGALRARQRAVHRPRHGGDARRTLRPLCRPDPRHAEGERATSRCRAG